MDLCGVRGNHETVYGPWFMALAVTLAGCRGRSVGMECLPLGISTMGGSSAASGVGGNATKWKRGIGLRPTCGPGLN